MSHEKEKKEKSGKKVAVMNLKEKRAAKAAKRNKKDPLSSVLLNPLKKTK
ncbi:MAG: hypothetical protein P1P82_00755 [Bacteroidales bacterium]|nr:hypothetical protein [Bacteroidales bacterium]MDT8430085.1 hypothetical protein [Bacteroidales bacterium]